MDLTRIDPTTWLPYEAPITHYKTLIWNERFFEPSSMELTTYAVRQTMDLLPLGSLVSIRQSREVLRVEQHEITYDTEGVELLALTAVSLTSYLDHRVIGEKRGVKYRAMFNSNLASGILLLYNAFVNDQAWDLTTRTAAYYKNPKDAIPNVAVTDGTGEFAISAQGPSTQRWLDPGPIKEPVRNFFSYRPYGLRIVRPPYSANKVSIAQDGTFSFPWVDDISELCFDAFKGTDRSYEQSAVQPVIFDTEIDDLITPSYLLANANVKTEVHVCLDTKAIFSQSSDPSGLDRRVQFFDGGSPEDGFDQTEWESYTSELAESVLEDHTEVAIVDGEVSPQSKLQFNKDYYLGDIVSVRGRYGALSKARVTEFIRAKDENGISNYPGLSYTV